MNKEKRMTRYTSLFLLFSALMVMVLFPEIGNGQQPADKRERSVPSLGNILDTDGRIKKGVVGGFDTAGFEMELDERGAPRFVPSSENQRKKGTKPAVASPAVTGVECNASYDPRFYNSGAKDDSFYDFAVIAAIAVDASGNIYIGGRFAYVDNIVSYNIARYNPTTDTWSPLAGDGLNSSFSPVIYVRALAISGNDLIVGGRFTETHDGSVVNLNNIARYNLATDTWSPLAGNGLNININGGGFVNALAISGPDVFVAGNFLQTADGTTNTNLSSIARYNLGTNTWSAFAENGLFAESINALALSGADLYVGGMFDQTVDGTTPDLHNLARYNIATNTWSALTGNGVNGEVFALLVNSGEMYIGGQFSQTHNGAIVNLNNIARYNLGINAWTPFAGNGLNNKVLSFAVSGNHLFVGGTFSETFNGSTPNLNHIARYDLMSPAWSPLTGNGLNLNSVDSLLNVGGDLYVGGYFKQTFDGSTPNINSIARYKTATNAWSFLGSNNGIGLDSTIKAVAVDANGNVYVGGLFSQTASGVMTNLNGVARYDYALNSWGGLAGGGVNGGVNALAISGNDLFVGGDFTATADGSVVDLNRIARYNTVSDTWSALNGNGLNGTVNVLLFENTTLLVGGSFSQTANGTTTNMNNITRYIPGVPTWFPYPNGGLNNAVSSLAVTNDVLYVGGSFSATFDGTIIGLNNIARFTNAWSGLPGGGMNAPVNALAVSATEVFAGGSFSSTFDSSTTLNHIARHTIGSPTWAPLAGDGLNNTVHALALNGDKLYIGGSFTATTNLASLPQHLGGYNTTTNEWAGPSGNGGFGFNALEFDEDVLALTLSGNDLIIGGVFSRVANCGVGSFLTRHYLQRWNSPLLLADGLVSTDWSDGANWATGTAPAANTNAYIPAGSGNINITSADVTMNDLVLGGGNLSVGPGRTLTINGYLALKGGTISGSGTVIITNCKPDAVSGGDVAKYVQATMVRCVNNSGTFNFPVGTANGYSPVTVKNIAGNGNVSVKTNQGAYSNPAAGLPANRLGRWWQIENPGGGITNSSLFFNYLQSDITGNEYGYRAYRIAGGSAAVIAGSINWFSNTAAAENVTAFSDWTLAEAIPTSAGVAIGGRVLTSDGNPIGRAIVSLSDQNGNVRRVLSGSFGNYRFDDVAAGQTYTLSVGSKRYQFGQATRIISVTDYIADLDFIAIP